VGTQRGAPATVYRIGGLIQSRIEQHKSERRGGKKDRQEGEVDPTQHLRNQKQFSVTMRLSGFN
jgi:hypothetical protein